MTGIFIVARLGSTRLSQKHLIRASGWCFIEWLTARFAHSFRDETENKQAKIFIVTSDREENRAFEDLLAGNETVEIFYGADSNIPLRQLQCARAHGISEIVSIDGDDVLCSTRAAQMVKGQLLQGTGYCKTSGLPLGMNVLGFRKDFLEASVEAHSDATLETGWGRIFNTDALVDINLGSYDKDARLRLTLDYEEDARFFGEVIGRLGKKVLDMDDASLIDFIIQNKLYEINQDVNEEYWKNFNIQKNAET